MTDTAGNAGTATASVSVDAAPVAALTVSPSTVPPSVTVTANASASTDGDATPIYSYRFDFGDGSVVGPQSTSQATHSYTATGTYTVTVTVTDTGGLASQATAGVVVDSPPAAALTVTPASGVAPLAVTADASASTDSDATPIASYTFNFGDGTVAGPQPAATATHTYGTPGTYTAKVTVTDTAGLTSSAAATVTVSPSPTAGCTTNNLTRPAPTTAITYVGRIASCMVATHAATATIAVGSAGVAQGDSILVAVQLTNAKTGAITATDSAGNSYHLDTSVGDGSAHDRVAVLSSIGVKALAPGATITVNFPKPASFMLAFDEFSGIGALDRSSTASATSANFSTGTTGVTTRAAELLYAVVGVESGKTATWSAGWTPLTSASIGGDSLNEAYQVATVTGQFAATGSSGGTWMASLTTY